jgi:hypothetical protein
MSARARAYRGRGVVLAAGAALGLAALVVVHVVLYDTYWDYSEGVYALSSHLMLHGSSLYGSFAGAQPPGVFLAGAALLAIHDSLEWLRFSVACLQLGAGLLAGQVVLRVTGSRAAAVLTPALVLLTPWAVHEHGALTPELVALPVLLGAALAGVEERRAAVAGVLCGILPLIKVPFATAAVVIVALSADWRRVAPWALGTLAVGVGLTWALAGEGFWREAVYAQTQTGSRSLGALKGFWAQAAWNAIGLLACGGIAVWLRRETLDARMLRMAFGLAAAMVITFLTNFKEGTGLNVAVPVEAALVPLAVAGTVFAVRARRSWLPVAACAAAWLFTLAQSVSLMVSPGRPEPFLRAGSANAWYEVMDASQMRAAVAAARRCPDGVPYSGPPLIALVAGRPMPGGQPDQFITGHARTLGAFRARIEAVRRVCP